MSAVLRPTDTETHPVRLDSNNLGTLHITPLDAPLGARVSGIDLRDRPTAAQVLALKAALRRHHILVFSGQSPSDQQYLDFTLHFGTVFTPPRNAPVLGSDPYGNTPDVVRVSNVDDGLLGNHELPAHADHHWTPQPSAGSLLLALEVPEQGGDTTWRNLALAYDTLDEATRREIDGLQLITYNPFLRSKKPLPGGRVDYRTPDIGYDYPILAHPLVRTHPETGEDGLFINFSQNPSVIGWTPEQSKQLIDRLLLEFNKPEHQVRFKWQPGSVAFWDNRSTLHYPVYNYGDYPRRMERVLIAYDDIPHRVRAANAA